MCTYCFPQTMLKQMCTRWGNIFTNCFLPFHLERHRRVISMHESNRPILFPCRVQSNNTDKTGRSKHDLFVHLSPLQPKLNCFLPSHIEVSMSLVYARARWTNSTSMSSLVWHKKRHIMSNTTSVSMYPHSAQAQALS